MLLEKIPDGSGIIYHHALHRQCLRLEYQSQIVFGFLIAIFPTTMIFVGKWSQIVPHRLFGYISGLLFSLDYLLAGYSQGNFLVIFLGIGVLAGIGTGFGYWLSLTTPVQWFPKNKGLITGIAAAGFGLGAVFMSQISEWILSSGHQVLDLLKIIGVLYGTLILLFSDLIFQKEISSLKISNQGKNFMRTPEFALFIILWHAFRNIRRITGDRQS